MSKTIKILLFVIIATVIIGTFVINPLFKWFFGVPNQSSIYDNDKVISSNVDSYSYFNRQGKVKGDKADLSFKLTGMDTLWRFNIDKQKEVTLKYDIEMQAGQFKIVLIKPNKEVITLIEGSGEGEVNFTFETGKNTIKMVGREANIKLKLELEKE